jgi:Flp pilus assembly protein TadD
MAQTGSAQQADRWYFGAAPDLLLGCGAGYFAVFAAMAAFGDGFREFAPMGLLPLLLLVSALPHYGATLLRVCERPEDRRSYSFVTLLISVVTLLALVISLQSVLLGSWLLTIYLTWSPWHYSGQNYGISMMFLRRRGVEVTPLARRLLHWSFGLSFALIALSIHGSVPGANYAPVSYQGTLYGQISLGVPEVVRQPLMIAVAVAYVGSLLGAGRLLLRGASLRDLVPALVVVASQGLWFAIPALARLGGWFQDAGPLSSDYSLYAFVWVAVAHSIQYLWVTSFFAARSAGLDPAAAGRGFKLRYAAKVLAAGAALWVIPGLVFAPGALGDLPFDAGLAVMIASAVNLHHFLLDGVIWKLRDQRIARVLIRTSEPGDAAGLPAPVGARRGFAFARLTPLAWGIGFACVAIYFVGTWEVEIGIRRAVTQGDTQRALVGAERLRWIGRDSAKVRLTTGLAQADSGDLPGAIARVEGGVALHETSEIWGGLGSLYERDRRYEDAIVAYRKAQQLGPETPELMNNLAWLLALHRRGDAASAREAVALATRASKALDDRNPAALDTLAAAYAAAGRFREARQTSRRAIEIARAGGDEATAAEIGRRLALYRNDRPYTP